ncbi:MAG: thiol peroxidase [Candidatus Omnitrophota bacterium]|jgi:thiol peroxidase
MSNITMKGNPVTLLGTPINVGDSLPDTVLTANDMSDFVLSSLKGKKVIVSVVPSLDTGVCDLQTKRFNEEASNLGDDVLIVTVSVDLPFAQKRWCGATGSESLQTVSDYKNNDFGKASGLLIDGLLILTRAIFVADANGVVTYKEIVSEITTEPNYDAALAAIKSL